MIVILVPFIELSFGVELNVQVCEECNMFSNFVQAGESDCQHFHSDM